MFDHLLARAWAVRLERFGNKVEWIYPSRTVPVSLTGSVCSLDCAHCGGHYLRSMVDIREARTRIDAGRADSVLVSGGCGPTGKVPVMQHLDELACVSQKAKLNFHVGLVNSEEAAAVGKLAAAVSFDFVGDDQTIREVYGLDASVKDYETSYSVLRRHARVIPHLCVGLRGGRISGEMNALRRIRLLGAEAVAFIVFIPTPGTRYADRQPPAAEDVATIIAEARLLMPETPLMLGCMRPGGRYRGLLDVLALDAGANRIVNPSREAVRHASSRGLSASSKKECCVL